MKTVSEVQTYIFEQTGLKTTVKKGVGSMKGYMTIRPLFQDGSYKDFPFDFVQSIKPLLSHFSTCANPTFCVKSSIDIYGIPDDRIEYKKERKPKPISDMNVKGWGSKNSQMRLDKASARYAKKRSGPNGDNMVKYW